MNRTKRKTRQTNMRLDVSTIQQMDQMVRDDPAFYNRTHLVERLVDAYYRVWIVTRAQQQVRDAANNVRSAVQRKDG